MTKILDNPLAPLAFALAFSVLGLLAATFADAASVRVDATAVFTRVEQFKFQGDSFSVGVTTPGPLTYEVQVTGHEKNIILD